MWYLHKEGEVDLIYRAWQALPAQEWTAIERSFRAVDEMACEAGIRALIEEGRFQGVNLSAELEELKGFHHKAMWAYLKHENVFQAASFFNYVECLSSRSWIRASQMPPVAPDVSPAARDVLSRTLSAYYDREQGRGRRCTVEYYRRGEHDHYLFAYPDDYAETYVGHGDDGRLIRRAQKKAFEVIFVLNDRDRTLDLYAQGDGRLKVELRRIFCATVLHAPNTAGVCCDPAYDLRLLRTRGFRFPTDPEDGIEAVRVRRLRLSLGGGNGRIVLEPPPAGLPEDVYDMMDECLSDKFLQDPSMHVTQVTLQFRLAPRGDGRPKKLEFDVTSPDGCSLKSHPDDMRALGEKYLKRWGIDIG
jgi:hypothetical protein